MRTFKKQIQWDVIDYDYIPNSAFEDETLQDVLIADKCKHDRLKEKHPPIILKYLYNYEIKKLNNDGHCPLYISIDDMLQNPELFSIIPAELWCQKDAYRYYKVCGEFLQMNCFGRIFHKEYYYKLKDIIDWEDVSGDAHCINTFTCNELKKLESYVLWDKVTFSIDINMNIVEAIGYRLDWNIMLIKFIQLPCDIQTKFLMMFKWSQLCDNMKRQYWFQEKYIEYYTWTSMDFAGWKPASLRQIVMFRRYIWWNKYEDFVKWESVNPTWFIIKLSLIHI